VKLKEIGREGVDCIHLAQNGVRSRDYVNMGRYLVFRLDVNYLKPFTSADVSCTGEMRMCLINSSEPYFIKAVY
jgi:hypothetical protein